MPPAQQRKAGAEMMRIVFASVSSAALLHFPFGAAGSPEAAPDLMRLLRKGEENYRAVNDYTTTFHKQQRVRGYLYPEETMFVKFKKPFMVYMKWTGDVDTGREVLYVRGKHGNKILAHPGGIMNIFMPTVSLHPLSMFAMRKNLRPITESGVGNTIRLLLEVCERAAKAGDLEVVRAGEGEVGGRRTERFERLLPAGKGYPAHRTIIEIDKETKFPLLVESHGWKNELLEKYVYDDIKLNTGLTKRDFDWRNSAYGFGHIIVPLPSE